MFPLYIIQPISPPSIFRKTSNLLYHESVPTKQVTAVTEFDDVLVHRLTEKVTVYDGRFVVTFRSGVEVEFLSGQ